jgi:acyl phosphate:glycerol-3-phosphate acyltransferase
MQTVLIVVLAYLLGSVSFAILVSRVLALPDPRSYGSGNPGATNVLRSGSRAAAALTLIGDAGKGWLAVWLAALASGAPATQGYATPLAGLAVFCGHLFPVFHRFRGGKGVATAAGVLLALNGWLGLATLATWAIVVLFFRISSLAALAAALFAPFYAWWLFGPGPLLAAVVAIALLLAWRHRANIARLASGEEPRIGAKRNAAPPA